MPAAKPKPQKSASDPERFPDSKLKAVDPYNHNTRFIFELLTAARHSLPSHRSLSCAHLKAQTAHLLTGQPRYPPVRLHLTSRARGQVHTSHQEVLGWRDQQVYARVAQAGRRAHHKGTFSQAASVSSTFNPISTHEPTSGCLELSETSAEDIPLSDYSTLPSSIAFLHYGFIRIQCRRASACDKGH